MAEVDSISEDIDKLRKKLLQREQDMKCRRKKLQDIENDLSCVASWLNETGNNLDKNVPVGLQPEEILHKCDDHKVK